MLAPLGSIRKRSVWRHLLANVAGRSWAFVSNFLLMPVYVRLLGMENFGVIALSLAVSGAIAFLDLGLSPTLGRELHDQKRDPKGRVDLLFTYELAYLGIVALIVLCTQLAPNSLMAILVSREDLMKPDVAASVRVVFIAASAQMLFNFYVAGLMGVEEQIKGNFVVVAGGVARSALVIVPLWFYPKPSVYLYWQALFSLLFAAVSRQLLYQTLRGGATIGRPVFSPRIITENLSFTRGMFLVAVISAILTQADKLFISRVAGIGSLGRYALVSTFAQLTVFIVSPITITMLPRFVFEASGGDVDGLRSVFVTAHRLVAVAVCSALGCMVFFGPYLISIWTMGKLKPEATSSYVAPLVFGYASVALQTVPHCVAVANKNLRGILVLGGVGAVLTVPGYWYAINRFGAAGAAATWLLLQLVTYPLYLCWVNHRFIGLRSLIDELLMPTVLVPTAVTLAICFVASRFLSSESGIVANVGIATLALVASACFCILMSIRRTDVDYLRRSVG